MSEYADASTHAHAVIAALRVQEEEKLFQTLDEESRKRVLKWRVATAAAEEATAEAYEAMQALRMLQAKKQDALYRKFREQYVPERSRDFALLKEIEHELQALATQIEEQSRLCRTLQRNKRNAENARDRLAFKQ